VKLKLEFFILTMLSKSLKKAAESGGGMRSYDHGSPHKSKKMVVVDAGGNSVRESEKGRGMISDHETGFNNKGKKETTVSANTE
jgi:hypothetical protein